MALLNIQPSVKVKLLSKTIFSTSGGYGYGYGGGGGGGLSSGLQAFYRLNDLSDSSGNNKTLTNSGGITFVSGKIGNAANLPGNDTLTSAFNGIIGSNTSGSYSCWVNRNGVDEFPRCLIKAFGTSVYADSYNGGRLLSYIPSLGEFAESLSSSVWAHVVLSFDKTSQTVKLYKDGQVFHTGSTENVFENSDFTIGTGDGQPGRGLVDAVGIWNRALTAGEISELYNSGAGLEI